MAKNYPSMYILAPTSPTFFSDLWIFSCFFCIFCISI